jgi:hypothetical protein
VAKSELPGELLKAGTAYTTRMASLGLRLIGALVPDVARVVDVRPTADQGATPQANAGGVQVQADAGSTGYGVFMVENRGPNPVTTAMTVSSFRADSGRPMRLGVRFEPDTLRLAPGEQAVVQVGVTVEERLHAGEVYRATITLPELDGATIPVSAIRRP